MSLVFLETVLCKLLIGLKNLHKDGRLPLSHGLVIKKITDEHSHFLNHFKNGPLIVHIVIQMSYSFIVYMSLHIILSYMSLHITQQEPLSSKSQEHWD